MRLFFLTLLLANIGLFVWHDRLGDWIAPPPPEVPAVSPREPAPTLILLSERAAPARGTPSQTVPGAGAAAARQCLSAAPFTDGAAAEQARAAAAAAGFDAHVSQEEREVTVNYVLLLPERYSSAEEAQGTLDALHAKGVQDVAAVMVGDQFAVSLGIYNFPKAMEKRRQEALAAGFTPEVRERRAKRTVYSLALAADEAHRAQVDDLKAMLGGLEPQLEWQEAACP